MAAPAVTWYPRLIESLAEDKAGDTAYAVPGKLFLAEDGPERIRDYARRTGLPASTPTSISTLPALEKELKRVRRHDVAFDLDEVEAGVRCIAAGIRDDAGELIAGLSLSTPSERFNPDCY